MEELDQDDAGFAAVDALTAPVILSTTIALLIGALSSARKIQRAAVGAIADAIDTFTPAECAKCFAAAGYDAT